MLGLVITISIVSVLIGYLVGCITTEQVDKIEIEKLKERISILEKALEAD